MIIVGTVTVVDAPPTSPPPGPVVAETAALSWRWTSWDGREWNLTDWSSPVIKLKGASGLGPMTPEHVWDDSPSLDGSPWQSSRIPRGSVFLPIMVRADSSDEFMVEHRRFLRSLNPRQEGTLRVTHPNGTWREQRCRYESGADLTMTMDPVKSRRAVYGITWATGDPFWSGEPVNWSVEYNANVGNFYPGPPFTLAPAQLLGDPNAQVDNPGDVDAYPVWRIDGPFNGFTAGVGTTLVTSTLTKPFGGWVEIDMRREKLTVLDEAGADCWPTLTDAYFSSIPPGVSKITTTSNGAGSGSKVALSFRPRYEGAF